MVTGVVMASGYSRRFGSNKLLTIVRGVPLFVHTVTAASMSHMDQVIVVSQYAEILAYSEGNGLVAVYNLCPEKGQSQSVKLGVMAADYDTHYLFLPADLPNITASFINQLLKQSTRHPKSIILPTVNGVPASPVLFPPAAREELLQLTGDRGGRHILTNHPSWVLPFPVSDTSLLRDIDTPQDLEID